ncbi:membrane metallo-endopeptidase-like 1 [Amblyomma americanum]
MPGIKAPSYARLDESFFEKIDIRQSPRAEIAASKKLAPALVGGGVILAVGMFAIVAVSITILAHFMKDAKFCNTADCIHHASLLRRINSAIDPCDDFSAFVCSGFLQARFGGHVKSTIEGLRFKWYEEFGKTLRMGTTKIPAGRKAIAMYEMCRGRRPVHGSQLPLLRAFLQDLRLAWPKASNTTLRAFSVALSLAFRWQVPFWFAISVLEDSSSGRRRVVVRPGTYVPILLNYHRRVVSDYLLYYKSYYAAYTADSDVNEAAVDEMRVLEHTVLFKLNSVSKSLSPTPSVFSFREVDRRVPNASTAFWLPLFDEGLNLQPRLTPDDEVVLSDIGLLEAFNSLVVMYGDQNLKALLAWQLVQFYSPLAEISLMTARFGSKQKAEIFRPAYCAHHVEASFKVLVLSLATISRITVKDRHLITTAFINLVSTALSKVNASRWMDNESKAQVTQKLALVGMQMWPPESLLRDDVLEETYSDVSENASLFEYWHVAVLSNFQLRREEIE